MAHKKAGGSTVWGRDSHGKRLGVKLPHGAFAHKGSIIVRQRGTKIRPGNNVDRGGDDTLFSLAEGIVSFKKMKKTRFDGKLLLTTLVSVVPVL